MDCLIFPNTSILGDVKIGEDCIIYPFASIRGDVGKIIIGNNTNIQDNVTIHEKKDSEVVIGSSCIIAHNCVIHGPATINDNSFIGFGSVVVDSIIGKGCVVGHNCTILHVTIPSNVIVPSGSKITNENQTISLRPVSEKYVQMVSEILDENKGLLERYTSEQSVDSEVGSNDIEEIRSEIERLESKIENIPSPKIIEMKDVESKFEELLKVATEKTNEEPEHFSSVSEELLKVFNILKREYREGGVDDEGYETLGKILSDLSGVEIADGIKINTSELSDVLEDDNETTYTKLKAFYVFSNALKKHVQSPSRELDYLLEIIEQIKRMINED